MNRYVSDVQHLSCHYRTDFCLNRFIFGIYIKKGTNIYLRIILRGRVEYELIYITNEAVGRVGYYRLISGKSEKNNCFSKFSSNSLDFFG